MNKPLWPPLLSANAADTLRDRATQDLKLQANYILVKGDRKAAEKFLECAELTFFQLSKTPKIGKKISLLAPSQQEFRQC